VTRNPEQNAIGFTALSAAHDFLSADPCGEPDLSDNAGLRAETNKCVLQ